MKRQMRRFFAPEGAAPFNDSINLFIAFAFKNVAIIEWLILTDSQ